MQSAYEWLGRWEGPMAKEDEFVELVPAVDARGYKYQGVKKRRANRTAAYTYPVMPAAMPKEKMDFSRAPQIDWWLDEEKKKSRDVAGNQRGIIRVLRKIQQTYHTR